MNDLLYWKMAALIGWSGLVAAAVLWAIHSRAMRAAYLTALVRDLQLAFEEGVRRGREGRGGKTARQPEMITREQAQARGLERMSSTFELDDAAQCAVFKRAWQDACLAPGLGVAVVQVASARPAGRAVEIWAKWGKDEGGAGVKSEKGEVKSGEVPS